MPGVCIPQKITLPFVLHQPHCHCSSTPLYTKQTNLTLACLDLVMQAKAREQEGMQMLREQQ